ncbi:serine/threonine-protein kinase [Streptomyces canus]|uniref:serine/threonine-protein kinase n=1 Tax=Streptomyces canus TaxID=58343 RepID=UPI000368CEAA|nr:serine/threonine-protein kinase [Streptomyces canus]
MNNHDEVSPDSGERLVAGRYRLLSILGAGGMGTVWRASDEVLHRDVAVKEVRASIDLPAERSKQMHVRLEREAWAAARVNARGVVTVHDVVNFDDRPWIVMELVRGRSLADVISAEGALAPQEVARIGTEVLAALRAAHGAGVLHRDVKPANVLLADEGRVVLTDFGIATVEGDTALTMTGEIVGSPEYLAPERALGRTPGTASDLWSLGALLYTAVQGRSPFRRTSALSTLRAIVDDELPTPHRAGPLTTVIEGLMRKNPEERMGPDEAAREIDLALAALATPSEEETAGTVTTDSATEGITAAVTAAITTTDNTATAATATTEAPETQATPLGTFGPPLNSTGFGPNTATPALAAGLGEHAGSEPAPAPRRRRPAYLIGAAAIVLVLSGGGVAYTLMNQDNDNGTNHAGVETAGSASRPVSVAVTGGATTYDGSCPSEDSQAPRFTATFKTDRAPVQFSYRWVSDNGAVVDREWRTLSFREGDPTTKTEMVRLSTWAQEGTLKSAMSVEIKSPFGTKSNSVSFVITCRANGE